MALAQKTLQGGDIPNWMWGALALPAAVGVPAAAEGAPGPGHRSSPGHAGRGVGGHLCHTALLSAATAVLRSGDRDAPDQRGTSLSSRDRFVYFPPDALGAFSLQNLSCFVN